MPVQFYSADNATETNTVTNTDGTLTISPTSGNVVASMALGHANTWTASQTFNAATVFGAAISTKGTSVNVTSVTTTYTVAATDDVILCNATTAAFTLTLPAANASSGRKILIIKTDSSVNAVTVSRAGTDTIEGATTKSLSSQYGKLAVASDGTSVWYDVNTGGV